MSRLAPRDLLSQDFARTLLATSAFAAMFAFAMPAHAAACSDALLDGGVVKTTSPLPATAALTSDTDACLGTIASALVARAGLRSITVTVRVSDAQRADGTGTAVAAAYVKRLTGPGGPAAGRVSSIVTAGTGDVVIAFTERGSASAVGKIAAASGDVRTGADAHAATAASQGARLAIDSWVVTGSDGTAFLELADGSGLRISNDTAVHLVKVHLDEQLHRVVQIAVERGTVEATVTPGGAGSQFEVKTAYGTAGVRGTVFRYAQAIDASRLETLKGSVALTGSAGVVVVDAGQGSRVGSSGAPSAPVLLPAAPAVESPRTGALPAGGLRFTTVPGAAAYRLEIARDAEMAIEAQTSTTAGGVTTFMPTLASGDWYWHVAAVSSDGFMGPWSQTFKFHVGT